jgi:hypothetical protein
MKFARLIDEQNELRGIYEYINRRYLYVQVPIKLCARIQIKFRYKSFVWKLNVERKFLVNKEERNGCNDENG